MLIAFCAEKEARKPYWSNYTVVKIDSKRSLRFDGEGLARTNSIRLLRHRQAKEEGTE